jgi:hypothetical protein
MKLMLCFHSHDQCCFFLKLGMTGTSLPLDAVGTLLAGSGFA